MHGMYQAVVVNTNDPDKAGRVKLLIPQVSADSPSGWAEPSDPQLAKAYALKSGTMVWAYFDGGSRSHPVYIPPVGALLIRRTKTLEARVEDLEAAISTLAARFGSVEGFE